MKIQYLFHPISTLKKGFGKISSTTVRTNEKSCNNCTTFECVSALEVIFKNINFFSVSNLAKTVAVVSALALILFYLTFESNDAVKSEHNHSEAQRQMFQSVPLEKAILLQEGEHKLSGVLCGMNLPMYYKTNHSATLDGKVRQYCSMHCLAKDLLIKNLPLLNMQVVDVESLQFIEASKAFYVLGSSKRGTMSRTSKYAFEKKENANAFAAKYGGTIVSFEEALKVARKDFPQ